MSDTIPPPPPPELVESIDTQLRFNSIKYSDVRIGDAVVIPFITRNAAGASSNSIGDSEGPTLTWALYKDGSSSAIDSSDLSNGTVSITTGFDGINGYNQAVINTVNLEYGTYTLELAHRLGDETWRAAAVFNVLNSILSVPQSEPGLSGPVGIVFGGDSGSRGSVEIVHRIGQSSDQSEAIVFGDEASGGTAGLIRKNVKIVQSPEESQAIVFNEETDSVARVELRLARLYLNFELGGVQFRQSMPVWEVACSVVCGLKI